MDFAMERATVLANGTVKNGFVYANIPLSLLTLKPEYQRNRVITTSSKLVKNWNDNLCDDILIADKGDRFNVIDGQARCLAAKLLGRSTIGCKIIMDITDEEEAELFAKQTLCVKRLTANETFHAEVVGNMNNSRAIQNICDEFGIKTTASERYGGFLSSIVSAKACYKIFGENGLRWVFSCIENAGWHSLRNAYSSHVIRALTTLYPSMGRTTLANREREEKLITYMKTTTPQTLIQSASLKYQDLNRTDAVTRVLNLETI